MEGFKTNETKFLLWNLQSLWGGRAHKNVSSTRGREWPVFLSTVFPGLSAGPAT